MKHILLTGATGFVGRETLTHLLDAGHSVACLIRDSDKAKASERFLGIARTTGVNNLSRLSWVPGDLDTLSHTLSVMEVPDAIVHCAGNVNFKDEAACYRDNIQAVDNLVATVVRWDVPELHYVSTAYCHGGLRSAYQAIPERDYSQGIYHNAKFNNAYERSKFLAELRINQLRNEHSVACSVYRPTIVAGRFIDGTTTCFSGFYQLVRAAFKLHQLYVEGYAPDDITLGLTGNEHVNIVPVDYVAGVITKVVSSPQHQGRVYHVTPSLPFTTRDLFKAITDFFVEENMVLPALRLKRPEYHRSTMAEAMLRKWMGPYMSYLGTDPLFSTANTDEVMKTTMGGRNTLVHTDYLKRIIRYAIETNFGRRKP